MRKLRSFITIGLHAVTTYRLIIVVWVLSGIIEPIIWGVLWFVAARDSGLPLSQGEVFSYYAFILVISRITTSWTFDDVRSDIFQGRYSKYLLWPSGLILYRFGFAVSHALISIVSLAPFWVVLFMWGVSNGLITYDLAMLPFALATVLLAFSIRFSIDMVLGHLALWFGRTEGLSIAYRAVSRILGGIAVPLMVLPDVIGRLAMFLPFKYIYAFPAEILIGTVSLREHVFGFGIGGLWVLGMMGILVVLGRYGLRNYEAVGI